MRLPSKLKKKGYMRILEASIAILILLSFVYFVTLPTYVKKTSLEDEIYKSINSVLDEIERNNAFREGVLAEDTSQIKLFVKQQLAEKQLDGIIVLCNMDSPCLPSDSEILPKDKDIFVRERVISTTLTSAPATPPKKAAVYAWTLF